ncbi:MAG TPA: hypothetical protein VHA53_04685 [Nitrolancea sp.]|nr:hypothetical protein [Nitrolancea sp.]
MYCPRCGARQPLGTTRCAECGTPFTRREASRRPSPQYAGASNTAAASYRRYERRSGAKKGLLAWLAVVLLTVIVVIALVAFFSTSIIKPYVGKSVSRNLDDQLGGSTLIPVTPNSGAALAGQTLTISQDEINQKIAENADALGPLDDVHVQITGQAFVVDFSAYGVGGQYTGQVTMQNGKPVLTNGHISGALGWVVPTDQVESAFNKQIASAVDQAGVQVSSVALQPGQLVLTLAS